MSLALWIPAFAGMTEGKPSFCLSLALLKTFEFLIKG